MIYEHDSLRSEFPGSRMAHGMGRARRHYPLMLHSGKAVILLGLLSGVLAGCGRGQASIPDGAQEVHVVITESEVRLDPSTVRAGDVYLVLDAPLDASIGFVKQARTAAATPGPLSDDDLARLARGDTQGTMIEAMRAGGCSPEQDAADRGQMGYCGNVRMVVLVEGKYAILGDAPQGDPTTGHLPPMGVLEVLP